MYLTTQDTHKKLTTMPPTGFEPTIPAIERSQTHALDRGAIGNGHLMFKRKGKAIPVQGWIVPECSRSSRFPDFMTFDTLTVFASQEIFLVLISVGG